MTDVTLREATCPRDPYLLWDTVWDADEGVGAWVLADPGEGGNSGGLAATRPLATSVINLLFTDRRCPPTHPLAKRAEGDLRGWWGDGVFAASEAEDAPLGSLLWLVTERGAATEADARWARSFAQEALAPLVRAGACARVAVDATAAPERRAIVLAVALYGRDGAAIYADRFDLFWGR